METQLQQKYQKDNPEIMLKFKFRKPSSPPLMNRKSESLQKCNAPSIQRRCVISRGNLSSSSSGSKQCAGLDMSESNIYKERMRKKHKYITQVTMEAEKAEVHPEFIALQTKKMTGHSFKSRLKRKCEKEIVPEDLALGKSEKHMNCQGIEERVHSASSKKKRRLKKKYLQCSPDKVDSGIDLLLVEEDIDIEDRIPLQQKLSLEIKGAGNSTCEEHYEGHTTLQQKLALENKSSGSDDAGNVLNNLQRKCDKRMKKLIQKQKGKIQEFKRVWEDNISKMEEDRILEAAIIRTIHGKASETMHKLKILDDKFAKKVAENNLLMDKQLTDLEAEQLAARNEESRKSATWLSEAKAYISSELTSCCKTQSFESQHEEVSGCSESRTHILGAKDVVTFTGQHGENTKSSRTVRGKQVVQSNNSDCATAEEIGSNARNGNPNNSINSRQKNEGGITFSDILIPAVVEQINQPKHLGTGESICANLPASGERVPDEMQSFELHGDVPEELEIVDNANSMDLSTNTPNEGFGEGGAIDLPDADQLTQPKHFGSGERIFGNLCDSGDRVPGEMQSLELHGDVPAELPETVAKEIVDNANPVDLSTNTPIEGFGEEDAIDLPDAEQLTQPKHFGSGERIFANLPDSVERVPGEMQSLELHGNIPAELPETVANEILDNTNPVDLITNTPIEGFGEGDAIDLPDAEQLMQPKHFGSGQRIFANLPDSGERDPGEIQSLELRKDIPAEFAETVTNEIVDDANPVELSINTSIKGFGEGDAIYLSDALLNKKNETDWTTIDDLDLAGQVLKTSEKTKASPHPCLLLPLRVQEDQDLVSAKIQNHVVQVVGKVNSSPSEVVVSELVDTATNILSNIEPQEPEEPAIETQSSSRTEVATTKIIGTVLAKQSSIKLQDQDASVVKDQVTLQIEVSDSERVDTAAPIAASEIVGSAKTLQSNIELQDQVEPAIETQSTSRIEVAPSENTNNATPVRSSTELQDEDALIVAENQVSLEIEVSNSGLADNATPVQVQSQIDAPAIENCEQLRLMPIDASPSCNQLPFVELESQIHNPGRNSSRAAETEVPSHEFTSQLREYVEPQNNYLDVGPESQSSHETSVEISASFQNNVATEGVASTMEIPHQDILQLGGVSHLPGQEVAAWNSPSMFAESLHNELERICKETEQLQKSHEDTVSLLKSECAKEMREIQNKYELKLQDAQAQLILKKNGLNQNQNKILMNKLLADACSYNCLWSTWPPLMLQSSPSNPMQYHQHVVRPVGATAPNQHIASLFGQAMQQISAPHSTRLGPANSQSFPARAVQSSQQAAAISIGINGAISRPQGINAVHHPTSYPRFGGGDIYSSAPHFQASISAAASSMAAATMLSALRNLQLQQQPPPLAAPQWLSSTQNPQHLGWQPALSHASLSALELLTGVEHHPQLPGTSMNLSFGSLQQHSYMDTLGNVQSNQRFCAAASNAICLSDDE